MNKIIWLRASYWAGAVVVGLMAAGFYAVASDIFPFGRIIPTTVLGVVLIALFSFSYLNANNAEPDPR